MQFVSISYKRLFILLVIIFTGHSVRSQIMSGDLFYTTKTAGKYDVTLTLSYTCMGSEAATEQQVLIFESLSNRVFPVILKLLSAEKKSISSPYGCVKTPGCLILAVYKAEIDLAPIMGGYDINWNSCCIPGSLTNIDMLSRTGFNLVAPVPGPESGGVNSMPVFNNLLFPELCKNQIAAFNIGGTDPDGDSLVYELQAPFTNKSFGLQPGNGGMGSWNKDLLADRPPYPPVQFALGYSNADPIGKNVVKLNRQNGTMEISADTAGMFLLGYSIREFRNSKLLTTHQRVIIITVNP